MLFCTSNERGDHTWNTIHANVPKLWTKNSYSIILPAIGTVSLGYLRESNVPLILHHFVCWSKSSIQNDPILERKYVDWSIAKLSVRLLVWISNHIGSIIILIEAAFVSSCPQHEKLMAGSKLQCCFEALIEFQRRKLFVVPKKQSSIKNISKYNRSTLNNNNLSPLRYH